MNTREQLNQYLLGLEKRLRLLVVSRGVAVAVGVALGATLALVLITNAFAFSDSSMIVARVVLFLALATAVALGIVMPLLRLNQRRAAGKAEASYSGFEERLVTYVERRDQQSPMLDLLAMDTMEHAPKAPATSVIPQKSIFAFATSAGAAGAVLLWMILAGPGFLGFGAKSLWAGPPKGGVDGARFYNIIVEPGNKLVRRRSDLPVTARLVGFQAPEVRLMARYKSSAKWEEAPMLPRSGDNSYEFLFPSVPEPVEYYVDAAGVKSKTFKIDVIDLAGVKNIKVTYHYPTWLGLQEVVENPGGDLRAVVGTVAELNIETDRPLKNGVIELEDGSKINLEAGQGNFLTAHVPIQRDGVYHFAAIESSESVRLSQDYFIEAKLDGAPTIKISHPGGDAKVSPIEEMVVKVEASDDFGLQAMDLHYSVNGAPEKVVSLLGAKGAATSEGKFTINLEEFKMIPGDVVSMYATAKDARTKATSDIMFAEAQPFERNFTQSQQAGGGGGGGGGGGQQEQEQIAKRQRDIISATHKALNGGPKDKTATAENASFLSEMQNKLKEQAASLASRTTARELTDTNEQFESFTKEMKAASDEMGPAADKLKAQKWEDAVQPEQRALTHLQRAMALFRDIQVARGQQGGGGGGGGGSQAARDLANLFDLELDTEKNQYEQAQGGGGGGAQQQQEKIDEAIQKLNELAKRQEQLANQNRNGKQQQQIAADRWQQEQLRREAEELRKQLEQLQQQQQGQQMSRNGQQGQSQQSQQSQAQQGQQPGQSQSQSQSKGGQGGQQSASAQQLQQMMQNMQQAMENQREAQRQQANGNQAQADAAAQRAAEQLKQAGEIGKRLQRQDTNAQLGDLQNRADQMAAQQKDFEDRLKAAATPQPNSQRQPTMNREQAAAMADEQEKLLAQLKKLEEDINKQARDLRNAQPDASTRLRDGLSEIQQNDVERRLEVSAEYIRAGQAASVVQNGFQAPVGRSLESLRNEIARAQQALKDGNQQGAGLDERQRLLNNIEQSRAQIAQLSQQGRQQGQQNGQQKGDGKGGGQQKGDGKGDGQGKGDGKGGGQQPGDGQGQAQGNNNPNNQGGGGGGQYNGGGYAGGRQDFGRYNPNGVYDPRGGFADRILDPNQVIRESQRQLNDARQFFRNNADITRQIGEVERALQQVATGDTSTALLQERLGRTVLPQLETLELQMRREIDQTAGGQVRSGGSDKMPAGYADQVAEYYRNLNKSGK